MRGDRRSGTYWVPGDPRTYVLPQDIEALDAAWDRYAGGTTPADDIPPDSPGGSHESTPESRERKRRHDEAIAFIKSYTGSFGLILDLRSDRRWGTKHMRLSERQVDAVLASRDRDAARDIERELWQDDVYIHQTQEANDAPDDPRPETTEAPRLEAQRAPGQGPRRDVPDGWYVVDGEPWKVQWNREHTRKYAKRLVVDPHRGGEGEDRDAGHHPAAGSWQYVPGGLGIVAARGEPMTLEVAQGYGKLYGVCAICGATLTDETSIADGIGPICKGKISA